MLVNGPEDVLLGFESPLVRVSIVVGTGVVFLEFAELWHVIPLPFLLFAVAMVVVASGSKWCLCGQIKAPFDI